jgi:2-haloalkanoic acid dehalogenase type II
VNKGIGAVAFDCYGTLVDFGDASFAKAYATICFEQGLPVDGKTFFDKWMEVWRRLAGSGQSSDGGSVGVVAAAALNQPGPLSEAEEVPPHPQHHTPSAGRSSALDGPLPDYRPYREEWPEHFAICFEELGLRGDPLKAHERLVELIGAAQAFPESRRVVETLSRRLPTGLLSNADDDFLLSCLARNGLVFPVVVSSETAQAYKPHAAIFRKLAELMGLAPEEILYVGDSRLADVIGAKNARLRVAWVRREQGVNGNRSIEAGGDKLDRSSFEPDYEIESLDRLLEILA